MKRFCIFLAFSLIFFSSPIFAQNNNDAPYLSEADIAAIEMVLADDIPDDFKDGPKTSTEAKNEITRLNSLRPVYHLLILDRTFCARDSDFSDTGNVSMLYKYKHGRNRI